MPEAPRAATKVVVFGSGTFGTALGTVVARNGYAVTVLTRREEVALAINTQHTNPQHLSEYKLPVLLSATTSFEEALKGVKFIVHCIPVQATEAFLKPLKDLIPPDVPIISTSKGLHSDTLETMADLIPRVLERPHPTAFFSGPTFAKELMEAYPSGSVMASSDPDVADECADLFHCTALRVYTTTDVVGVEIGGALKNVYAIAAGFCEGLGLGSNSMALLVTRACAEMNLLAVRLGARAHTMSSLAGIGDLMLTCMGGASRNKAVGQRIGRGESLSTVLEARKQSLEGVAEGVATAPAAAALAKKAGVEAPIAEAVNAVLSGKAKVQEAILLLMQRPKSEDFSTAAVKAEKSMAAREHRRLMESLTASLEESPTAAADGEQAPKLDHVLRLAELLSDADRAALAKALERR